jgi:redox-sensitive bicupin YhaK (pirin superfamily)
MMFIREVNERGQAEPGWQQSDLTFSFAEYCHPQWLGFRSLRVINDDLIRPGMGLGMHPHRGMKISSCVLTGALQESELI